MVVIEVEAAVAAVGLGMGTSQPQDYSVCLSRCTTDTAQRREMGVSPKHSTLDPVRCTDKVEGAAAESTDAGRIRRFGAV